MSVFSRTLIETRLALDIADPLGLVITPLKSVNAALDEDSIDLRLGSHFILPANPPSPAIVPGLRSDPSETNRVHVPLGQYLVIPAHQTVLGMTLEFIKLPCDASGLILTKSSVARTFMVIETAPWIHPCYRGCLTLEIANVSNTALVLYPGRPIGQLVLMGVEGAKMANSMKGTYIGPVFPETPKFHTPKEDLEALGVPSHRIKIPEFL